MYLHSIENTPDKEDTVVINISGRSLVLDGNGCSYAVGQETKPFRINHLLAHNSRGLSTSIQVPDRCGVVRSPSFPVHATALGQMLVRTLDRNSLPSSKRLVSPIVNNSSVPAESRPTRKVGF